MHKHFITYDNGNVTIDCACSRCHETVEIYATDKDYQAWKEGEHLRVAMPYVNPLHAQVLKTGICGKCINSIMFPEDANCDDIIETFSAYNILGAAEAFEVGKLDEIV